MTELTYLLPLPSKAILSFTSPTKSYIPSPNPAYDKSGFMGQKKAERSYTKSAINTSKAFKETTIAISAGTIFNISKGTVTDFFKARRGDIIIYYFKYRYLKIYLNKTYLHQKPII